MSEWQPIETAPKDGTFVDLWVVEYDGWPRRLSDMFWATGAAYWRDMPRKNRVKEKGWPRATHWRHVPTPPSEVAR